jgi:hypothetical protein
MVCEKSPTLGKEVQREKVAAINESTQKSLKDWGVRSGAQSLASHHPRRVSVILPAKGDQGTDPAEYAATTRPSVKLQQRASSLPSSQRRLLRRLRGSDENSSLCTQRRPKP